MLLRFTTSVKCSIFTRCHQVKDGIEFHRTRTRVDQPLRSLFFHALPGQDLATLHSIVSTSPAWNLSLGATSGVHWDVLHDQSVFNVEGGVETALKLDTTKRNETSLCW